MVRIAAELRRQYKENEIPYGPSVGDLCNWGLLVSDGALPIRAAEETIVAMISDSSDVQDNVRRLVKLVFTDSSYTSAKLSAIPTVKMAEPIELEPVEEPKETVVETAESSVSPDQTPKKKFTFQGTV